MTLPVFELIINKDEASDIEVSFVALVDKPAIERDFLTFKNDRIFFAVNEEKKIISGPAMIADQLIYRRTDEGEFNVFFSKETVREIAIKFFKKDYQKNLNLFHDPALSVEGVTIFESFVSDSDRGVKPMAGFEDLPDGTWFISAKVDNDDVWKKIKSGEVKGFSVEGIFSYMKPVNGTGFSKSPFHVENEIPMSEIKDLWKAFKDKFLGEPAPPAPPAPAAVEMKEMTLKDGTKVMIDKVEVGGVVMVGDAPAAAGTVELEDGTVVTIGEAGVITEVKPKDEPAANMPPDYSANFAAIEERFSSYDERIRVAEEAYSKQSELVNGLVEIVNKIIDTPTADPIGGSQGKFNSNKQTARTERIAELAEKLKNLKSK
jgi:hypothetical protein